jgi:hypothetical protein
LEEFNENNIKLLSPLILLVYLTTPVSAEISSFLDSSIHGHVEVNVKFPDRTLEEVKDL